MALAGLRSNLRGEHSSSFHYGGCPLAASQIVLSGAQREQLVREGGRVAQVSPALNIGLPQTSAQPVWEFLLGIRPAVKFPSR